MVSQSRNKIARALYARYHEKPLGAVRVRPSNVCVWDHPVEAVGHALFRGKEGREAPTHRVAFGVELQRRVSQLLVQTSQSLPRREVEHLTLEGKVIPETLHIRYAHQRAYDPLDRE